MARRPERNFFEQLRRNLAKSYGAPIDLQRIENTTCNGVPDLNYCISGCDGWAELKAWERIRLSGRFTIPKLREEQAAWLGKRAGMGGRAYLLCRINKDVVLIDGRIVPYLFNKELHLDWADGEKVATIWCKHPINWENLAIAMRGAPMTDTWVKYAISHFKPRTRS